MDSKNIALIRMWCVLMGSIAAAMAFGPATGFAAFFLTVAIIG
jgi:hypothetical protein